MELIGQRMLDGLEAAELYTQACKVVAKDKEKALSLLAKAEKLVRTNRDAHEALGREFKRLWLAESEPYALDWTLKRYRSAQKRWTGPCGDMRMW